MHAAVAAASSSTGERPALLAPSVTIERPSAVLTSNASPSVHVRPIEADGLLMKAPARVGRAARGIVRL